MACKGRLAEGQRGQRLQQGLVKARRLLHCLWAAAWVLLRLYLRDAMQSG